MHANSRQYFCGTSNCSKYKKLKIYCGSGTLKHYKGFFMNGVIFSFDYFSKFFVFLFSSLARI